MQLGIQKSPWGFSVRDENAIFCQKFYEKRQIKENLIQSDERMSSVSHFSIFLQIEHIFLFLVSYQIILNRVVMPSAVFSSLITNLLIPPRVLAAAKVRHSPSIWSRITIGKNDGKKKWRIEIWNVSKSLSILFRFSSKFVHFHNFNSMYTLSMSKSLTACTDSTLQTSASVCSTVRSIRVIS